MSGGGSGVTRMRRKISFFRFIILRGTHTITKRRILLINTHYTMQCIWPYSHTYILYIGNINRYIPTKSIDFSVQMCFHQSILRWTRSLHPPTTNTLSAAADAAARPARIIGMYTYTRVTTCAVLRGAAGDERYITQCEVDTGLNTIYIYVTRG